MQARVRIGASFWIVAAALALAFYAALYEIRTYDTLFHLAAGRYLFEHGQLPEHDPFSFTHRGALWVNHSRGFQVLLGALHRCGGFALLSLYQACLAALLCALACLGLRGTPAPSVMLGAVLAALPYCAFREVLEARPHVLGFACLAGTLLLTMPAQSDGRARLWVWVVPLYAAWAASHGSHVLAYAVFGIGALCAALRGQRAMCAAYLALTAGCLLIMRAIAPWAFTQGLEHAGSLFLESAVSEWKPLTAADVFGSWPGRTFACLWLATLAGAALSLSSARRGDVGRPVAPLQDLLMLALFLALSLTSRRMIALFVFGAAPLWLSYAVYALRSLPRLVRFGVSPRSGYALCVAAFAGLFVATYAQADTFRTGAGLQQDRFPMAAVEAMRASGRVHRVYNAYNFGGYLMFARVPVEGVFVDGRALTLYPPEFLREFQAAYADPRRFEALAARFACDAVLLPVGSQLAVGLREHLQAAGAWRLTHRDPIAELYERAAPLTAATR